MRLILAISLAVALAPAAALAQTWQVYSYPDQGFAMQLPAPPAVEDGTRIAPNGAMTPAKVYSAKGAGIVYTLSVFDYSKSAADQREAIAQAERALGGTVAVAVDARINRQFGRELAIDAKDGSRLTVALFYQNQHLYQLVATALPPNATDQSAAALHFQQSLQFIGPDGGGGGGPGGDGGGRFRGPGGRGGGGFNPQAQAACAGKAAGDAVQLQTAQGGVAATCVLVARPNRPAPGGGPADDRPPAQ